MKPTTRRRSCQSLTHADDRRIVSIRTPAPSCCVWTAGCLPHGATVRVDPGDVHRLLARIPTGFS